MTTIEWRDCVRQGDLERIIRRMILDDALHFPDGHRLEYVQLDKGLPHFRLYRYEVLVGIVLVRSDDYIHEICHHLAHLLPRSGVDTHRAGYHEYGAETLPDATVHRLPHLFKYPPETRHQRARKMPRGAVIQ